jgi:hypothetical protein
MGVEVQTSEGMVSSADISACGRYRYNLVRLWNSVPARPRLVAFVALNPSTADATINDQTIRKEMAFAKQWAMDGLIKFNLYAWRETSPKKLFDASRNHDIIGPRNSADFIHAQISAFACDFVVVGWGTNANKNYASRIASRGQEVTETLRSAGVKMHCLKRNADGSPQHQPYISLSQSLQPWGEK